MVKLKNKAQAVAAASDEPTQLIDRALRVYAEAPENDPHHIDVRIAAALGWLAFNSFADAVAKRLGMPRCQSASERFEVLAVLDRALPRPYIQNAFTAARGELHGNYYRDDAWPGRERIVGLLTNIKDAIDDGTKAFDNPKTYEEVSKRRQRAIEYVRKAIGKAKTSEKRR